MEEYRKSRVSARRVWIDLDNTPHVPFFSPIIRELERMGYSVTITVRDAYQAREMATFVGLKFKCVGRHYGKHKLMKVWGTCVRAVQLLVEMVSKRADLAIAHGSRSQVLAATFLRIPTICLEDYEFGVELGIIGPTWLMVPKVLTSVRKGPNVLTYPGIKEDVYAPQFKPDPALKADLGISDEDLVVTVRPPASEAHYHRSESDDLFTGTMELLRQTPDAKVIVLPRNARQGQAIRATWQDLLSSGKVVIPDHAVDGLNLIWHSDLVISGGGTMNREAAALGVPVYSIFRGQIGVVDRHLESQGRLVLLEKTEDLRTKLVLKRRTKQPIHEQGVSAALATVVGQIVSILEERDPRSVDAVKAVTTV